MLHTLKHFTRPFAVNEISGVWITFIELKEKFHIYSINRFLNLSIKKEI